MKPVQAIGLVLLLAACGGSGESASIEPADTLPTAAAPEPPPATPSPPVNPVIRPDGIGPARIGMRIADLRRALPPGITLGDAGEYMVDILGVPVVQGSDTLFSVLVPADETVSDDTVIEQLVTTNAAFRTTQGVGPGMTIADAAAIYGQPTLSYNVNDESREYARFPALSSSIVVRVAPGSDIHGGFYETSGEYNETTRYDPTATVWMVMVRRY